MMEIKFSFAINSSYIMSRWIYRLFYLMLHETSYHNNWAWSWKAQVIKIHTVHLFQCFVLVCLFHTTQITAHYKFCDRDGMNNNKGL